MVMALLSLMYFRGSTDSASPHWDLIFHAKTWRATMFCYNWLAIVIILVLCSCHFMSDHRTWFYFAGSHQDSVQGRRSQTMFRISQPQLHEIKSCTSSLRDSPTRQGTWRIQPFILLQNSETHHPSQWRKQASAFPSDMTATNSYSSLQFLQFQSGAGSLLGGEARPSVKEQK